MAFPKNTLFLLIVVYMFYYHVFLSFHYSWLLARMFMKIAVVPIIKNKTGYTSDKNNYRPISLVTAATKIFELCLSVILENYLFTHDQQFGFKSKHSTDFCIREEECVKILYTTSKVLFTLVFWMHLKLLIRLIISSYFESYLT